MRNSEPLNRYGSLCAEIYDLDKPPGVLFDIAYYSQRLKGLEGRVLEAACGSGRLMIPLLESGVDVAGFDHSADMLAVCRGHATARGFDPLLVQARFQDFRLESTFAAIIVPASSFILVDRYDARSGRFSGAQSGHSRLDDANPFLLRDYDNCISCYRCVRVCAEQEGDYAISIMNRGFHTKITTEFDGQLRDSACTFCGQCVQTCPTGALGDKKALRKDDRRTR